MLAAGSPPLLGHRNAAETLNTYAHLWPFDEERIVAAIDGVRSGSVREGFVDGVVRPTFPLLRGSAGAAG
jgi:hypothetical protein